jgi:two-component system, NarL family, response regulator
MDESQQVRIRVFVLDDHQVVRHGIGSMIEDEPDLMLVGEAASAELALPLYEQHLPDVAIVDLRLPGMSGAAFIAAAKKLNPKGNFVVLTTWDSDEDIYEAFTAGANAYVLKDSFSAEIVDTIRKANQGLRIMPADIASRLDERTASASLSPREREVLILVAKGESNKLIAEKLQISEGTVKTYMLRIFEKLSVDDRTAAVTVAMSRGIIRI